MPQVGWMKLKRDTPVSFSDKSFFTDAQVIESRLDRIDTKSNPEEAVRKLIRYRVDLDNLVQEVIRQIYSVKQDVEEYEEISEVMYKLIEVNLKYYRKESIDIVIQDASGRGSSNSLDAEMLRTNMLKLVETLKHSFHNAVQGFDDREEQEIDAQIIFLARVAKNIESSFRYYGEYRDSDADDGVMDLVDDAAEKEGEEAKTSMEEYSDEIQDVNSALEEVEDELDDL